MNFYISWYPGDPLYPSYDKDCSLLISISSVSKSWTIDRFPVLPRRLLIDSGGYRFATNPQEALSPVDVLDRQLRLLNDREIPTIICARDYPILNKSATSKEKDKSITQTIAYAYELKNLIEQKNLSKTIIPMAVIQGTDKDSLLYCARELQSIGFSLYGLGSLAELRRHNFIMERVKVVINIIGAEKLHIFGVGIVKTVRLLNKLGIHSVDSSHSAKAAAYNEILYSTPYRRYGILEDDSIPLRGSIPKNKRLNQPLDCSCPICEEDAYRILGVGKKTNIRNRALHNYYHLKCAFFEKRDV